MAGREPTLRRQTGSVEVARPDPPDDNTIGMSPNRRLGLFIRRLGRYFNILVLHLILVIRGIPHRISWGKTENDESPKDSR